MLIFEFSYVFKFIPEIIRNSIVKSNLVVLSTSSKTAMKKTSTGSIRLKANRSHVKIETEVSEYVNPVLDNLTKVMEEKSKGESNNLIKSESDFDNSSTETKPMKITKWEPTDWRLVLENINKMREKKEAPVDTMGCERTMEENVEPKVRRYQTLISLMLSSQTKDQVTFAAMERLKTAGLSVQNILNMNESTLGQTIKPVGFFNRKATYIKKTTQILRDKYDDDIPNTVKDLCSLPGVGPKMAYICMNVAWGQNAGIGVDTHVHRITNRLKWTGPKETKTPERTREGLESWLPSELWQEVNILLVGFGQTVCLPVGPKCKECLNNTLCPYGQSNLKSPKKKGKSKHPEETSKYF